jgi:hypothetical protein
VQVKTGDYYLVDLFNGWRDLGAIEQDVAENHETVSKFN